MHFEISLLDGNAVIDKLNDEEFISSWRKLARIDKKKTIMQEPELVSIWYRIYYDEYTPLLCLGINDNNKLVGIIPLSINKNNRYIVHAGSGKAEYHGWIAIPEVDNDFPVLSVISVCNKYKIKRWKWGPLPPNCNTQWLYSEKFAKEKIRVQIRKEQSPLWDLNDSNKFNKIMKNKSIKTKINRYKRQGDFFLERISSKTKTEELIDIFADQCDFRKEAMHGVSPFRGDKNQKQFYIEKMKYPQANHFSVLWVGKKPIAFHYGDCDSDTVYIGPSSYCPLESKNSPGTILLVKLAELLKQEGYRYIDLTPGGDSYKERYANLHQEITTPVFFIGSTEKFKFILRSLRSKIHNDVFLPLGIDIKQLTSEKSYLSKIKKSFTNCSLKEATSVDKENIIELYIFKKMIIRHTEYIENIHINKQKYTDLFYMNNDKIDKSKIFLNSYSKFSNGDRLFTLVREQDLLNFGWSTKYNNLKKYLKKDIKYNIPSSSTIFYDFFSSSTDKSHFLNLLISEMLQNSFEDNDGYIYLLCNYNDNFTKDIINKIGFQLVGRF